MTSRACSPVRAALGGCPLRAAGVPANAAPDPAAEPEPIGRWPGPSLPNACPGPPPPPAPADRRSHPTATCAHSGKVNNDNSKPYPTIAAASRGAS